MLTEVSWLIALYGFFLIQDIGFEKPVQELFKGCESFVAAGIENSRLYDR